MQLGMGGLHSCIVISYIQILYYSSIVSYETATPADGIMTRMKSTFDTHIGSYVCISVGVEFYVCNIMFECVCMIVFMHDIYLFKINYFVCTIQILFLNIIKQKSIRTDETQTESKI